MSKTIVIFSTKGGVGKTLIATNLAVSLAKDNLKKVLLIDFDLHVTGDMARMLDLNPQRSIADLIQFIKKQPNEIKRNDFITKSPHGIDFLPAVLKAQQASYVDPLNIKDVFNLYEKDYDYIIVDAGRSISDCFVSVLNQANLILLVVTPDILSIYQTKWVLDTLRSLHLPYKMVRIILNRAESVAGVSWQEVRMNFPIDIIVHLPSEGKYVGQAVNRAIPVVIDNPRAKISSVIREFADKLIKDQDLFVEHIEIDQLRAKDQVVEKGGDFWQTHGLSEPLMDPNAMVEAKDEVLIMKRRIHDRLIEELNLKRMDSKVFTDPKKMQELKNKAEVLVANLLVEEAGSFVTSQDVRRKLTKEILDEALGLGPLEDLLADVSVTDIMVNNKDEIYVERQGKIQLTSKKFISNDQVRTIIERIIAPIGRRIDESVPMVDARLPDGSRVNAIIPPLALTGPTLTIRKFRKERYTIDELIKLNSLTQPMADLIRACVISRKNIIVSGGTGSGKTTALNILSAFIPESERIVTLEDAAELKLRQDHWVRLESRSANIEGKGAITIRDLFRNTLRMRPDRIIIGECRGLETLDMLQAMNTGHDGSMTTIHANATNDVLVRLDSMILMSGIDLPIRAIREMVASAINIIVHTARLSDGTRKVLQITEVIGMRDDLHVNLRDIFIFKQAGIDKDGQVLGEFQATGYIPSFIGEMKARGIPLSEDIFKT